MKKEEEKLKEWILTFIKNKDLILKSIQKIEENPKEWDIVVEKKEGKKHYIIAPQIDSLGELINRIGDYDVTIATLNRKQNVEAVISNWDKLILHPKLCIIFANPDSQTEKKWVLFPSTHHKITEKSALKKGLNAMFETVDRC